MVKQVKAAKPQTKGSTKAGERSTKGAPKGLKFALETYETVSKFTPDTRIKYGPNLKTVGSKSHVRYAKYAKAKTVGESLRLGSKLADLMWEYERGMYKVVGGPKLNKPNCCINPQDREKTHEEKLLSSWRGPRGFSLKMDSTKRKLCQKLAKQFGYDLDKLHEEADLTGNNESADVQTQRTLANALAEKTLNDVARAGRSVTDADVLPVLQAWGFAENSSRLNVLPQGQTWVYSDTLGAIRLRTGGYRVTDPTTAYPAFTKLICQWFDDSAARDLPSHPFVFTGINVNANYAGRVHRDANNEGPSAIKAVGSFKGGNLRYWPKDRQRPRPNVEKLKSSDSITLDLSKKFTLFNGNCAHGVEKFAGERFSLVFFTGRGYQKIKSTSKKELEKLGFRWPTPGRLNQLKSVSKSVDNAR